MNNKELIKSLINIKKVMDMTDEELKDEYEFLNNEHAYDRYQSIIAVIDAKISELIREVEKGKYI